MAKLSRTIVAAPTPSTSSAVERVIAHIRRGIREGRFAPGQRLIESDLQATLGVGRGSIREAIRRLAADAIVEDQLHKGARVRQLSLAEIKDIYEIREILEGLACRLAAANLKARDAQKLRAIERDFDQSFDGTTQSYLRYNEIFHAYILRMSGNAELIRIAENLYIPTFILLVDVLFEGFSIKRARAEHRPIVSAILKKDPAKAERAMRTHIRNTERSVLRRAVERLGLR
jgi:DNA-binding GntR family transcriptional regulator